jgi:UDP-N-acetylmuramoylalanine--D-glutamate ligase
MNDYINASGRKLFQGIRNIAVIGFGKTGKALLDFLISKSDGWGLFLFNDTEIVDIEQKEYFQKKNVEFLEGDKDFTRLEDMDLLLLSPGIDGRNPRFDSFRKSGKVIISEIELASYFIPSKIVAVTGTNGKSTTVSLIHHILCSSGLPTVLAGNIGNPLIAEVEELNPETIVVLEASSFQLEEIVHFRPDIGVLLNVTPDHLDRYPDLECYLSAKVRIGENQNPADFLLINYEDSRLRERVDSRARVIGFSISQKVEDGYYIEKNRVVENARPDPEEISLDPNPLTGIHNLENLLASIAVCRLLGLSKEQIETGMKDFRGLPHRTEVLGRVGRVKFINDSKATNVDAALKSINSFNSGVVLILGGKDKGGDFRILESAIKERTNRILLIGSAASHIYSQLQSVKAKMEIVKNFKEAVRKGYDTLKDQGGTVILAPGCASFDMFDNFEHRGECFRREFLVLKQEEENG